jgi:nitroreductase
LIENAIRIAQQSPSVFNRQASKIYTFDNQEMIKNYFLTKMEIKVLKIIFLI